MGVGNFDWFSFSTPRSGIKGETSEIVNVEKANKAIVYPSSVSNIEFFVEMENVENATLILFDLQGRCINHKTKIINNRKMLLTPESKIRKGVYLLRIENKGYIQTNKIIIH